MHGVLVLALQLVGLGGPLFSFDVKPLGTDTIVAILYPEGVHVRTCVYFTAGTETTWRCWTPRSRVADLETFHVFSPVGASILVVLTSQTPDGEEVRYAVPIFPIDDDQP